MYKAAQPPPCSGNCSRVISTSPCRFPLSSSMPPLAPRPSPLAPTPPGPLAYHLFAPPAPPILRALSYKHQEETKDSPTKKDALRASDFAGACLFFFIFGVFTFGSHLISIGISLFMVARNMLSGKQFTGITCSPLFLLSFLPPYNTIFVVLVLCAGELMAWTQLAALGWLNFYDHWWGYASFLLSSLPSSLLFLLPFSLPLPPPSSSPK
jgi:hypothetical protein